MSGNILREISSNKRFFSAVEKKIAERILDAPEELLSSTLTAFAGSVGASQGSVVNFAVKMTGGGFPALKLQVAGCINEYNNRKFSVVSSGDGVKDVFKKQKDDLEHALASTLDSNTEETLRAVADIICSSSKVEIYGIFRSAIVATDFYYQLIELGVPSSFVSDVLTCAVSASMLDKSGAVFAISNSGRTKDVLDAVKIAKERGVKVIALTANPSSPLAKTADYTLVACSSGNSRMEEPNEVRTSQLAVVDALCSYVRSKMEEKGEKRYFGIEEILNSHSVND